MLANHTSIRHLFNRTLSQFDKLFKRNAFVENYKARLCGRGGVGVGGWVGGVSIRARTRCVVAKTQQAVFALGSLSESSGRACLRGTLPLAHAHSPPCHSSLHPLCRLCPQEFPMFHRAVGTRLEANLEEFEDAREVVAALSEEYAAAESSDYVSGRMRGGGVWGWGWWWGGGGGGGGRGGGGGGGGGLPFQAGS
jgi:hypothetical protein